MAVVTTIPEAGLGYRLYGDNTQVVSNFLERQLLQMPQAFTDFAQRVYSAVQNSYAYVNDTLTKFNIMARVDQSGTAFQNHYEVLSTFEQLQNANPTMQRWVMSHPETRQLYLDQNLDGYSGQYHNVFGKGVGENDYNWRRVMDSVLVHPETSDDSYVRRYHEDLIMGDTELNHRKKKVVLDTWNTMDLLLHEGDFDFTCKSQEPVKINR